MKRRWLLSLLGVALVAPRLLRAQAAAKTVVVLSSGDSEDDEPAARAFYEEMRRRGWSEGVNINYVRLYGKGSRAYLEGLASSAAGSEADLVVASTGSLALAVL